MMLIGDPNRFFGELKYKDVRLRYPVVISMSLATLLTAYQYTLATKVSQALPEELSKFFVIGAYIGMVGSFIGIFAVWLILAVIMHGLSAFFGGRGSFRRTFEFVGYGFFPSLIGSAITVPMAAYYVVNEGVPEISLISLQQNSDMVKAVILSLVPEEVLYSNLVINFAVILWSLTIWSFAIRHARDIGLREAFLCALIPTAIFGGYQIWSILKLL